MTRSTPGSAETPAAPGSLLSVRDLAVEFRTPGGVVRAVNGVSFDVGRAETLAILGESGSGKSVTAHAVMGLVEAPGRVTAGSVRFGGADLLALPDEERRKVRGPGIAMVFQDPLSALNPVFSVGFQIAEMFRVHRGVGRREAKQRAVELLERVGIPSAATRVGEYPHQFSGGMRQRVMIAIAIALDPKVLIADEPTTALDVTVQAQILELLAALQSETGMGLVLITHDLGVAAEAAGRVAVMYAGRVVETGPAAEVLVAPRHPYTQGLLASLPRGGRAEHRLEPIRGAPPSLSRIPAGCPFHPRCPHAVERCRVELPPLRGSELPAASPPPLGPQPPAPPQSGAPAPRPAERTSACWRVEELFRAVG